MNKYLNNAKHFVFQSAYESGLLRAIKAVNIRRNKRLTIVTYHRVTDRHIEDIDSSLTNLFVNVDTFEKQILFFKNHYNIVSFDELNNMIRENRISDDLMVITFDDGYMDFYWHAYPIILRHNVPVTLFIVPEKIGKDEGFPFWWDEIFYYMNNLIKFENTSTQEQLPIEIMNLFEQFKQNVKSTFDMIMNTYSDEEIEDILKIIRKLHEIDRKVAIEQNNTLTWDQIREFSDLVDIGSHTRNHKNLKYLSGTELANEIMESKSDIEDKIKRKVIAFSYPNGYYNPEIVRIVKETGYQFAVTTEPGLNDLSDCFLMKRINLWERSSSVVPDLYSEGKLALNMIGLYHDSRTSAYLAPTDKKIQILFIIDSLNATGGTEKHLYYLLKHLSKDKYNCHVVTFSANEKYVKRLADDGFSVKVLGIRKFYGFEAIFKYMELVSHIRDKRYDIIQTYHLFSDTVGVLLARMGGVRNIVSSRRDMGYMKNGMGIFFNRVANCFIKKFIVVSNAVGNEIIRREHIGRRKVLTIYNGTNAVQINSNRNGDMRKKLGIGEQDFVLGMVGHFRPEKNHQLLFDAFKLVKEKIKNVKCVLIGSWLGDDWQKISVRMGISEDIIFTGFIDNVANYVSIFDVACLTSTTEGLSNALIEKMAMGKPVVATRVGGNGELVRDHYNGLLVSPDNPVELAEAILYLLNNQDVRVEMGKRNLDIIEMNFSIERMIRQHDALYKNLISGIGI